MKRKLIADAGSTKIDWVLISSQGSIETSFSTGGLNALLADADCVMASLNEVSSRLKAFHDVEEIDYYGAGCATSDLSSRMSNYLANAFGVDSVFVESDLLGAARSIFGDSKGIACILGTGSNSCCYDGKNIVMNIPSLGFILGDEGSGAALGKRLVSDVFKGQLPESVCEKFTEEYNLTLPDILDCVYRKSAPNRFLASFVPFLEKNLWNPAVYSLVLEELTIFFKRNVAMYSRSHSMSLGFTGSVASCFERLLHEAAASQGYRVNTIVKSPIAGLVRYHLEH